MPIVVETGGSSVSRTGYLSMGREKNVSSQSRDPALQPTWWMPWDQPQPEVPEGGVPLSRALEEPVLPGPGSASPSSVPNPYDLSGGGSMLAPCTDLAGALSWTTDTSVISEPVLNGSYSEPQLAKVLSWRSSFRQPRAPSLMSRRLPARSSTRPPAASSAHTIQCIGLL